MTNVVRLGDLFRVGSSKRVLKSQWQPEGVPFYRGREVTRLAADGFVENELFISESLYEELSGQFGVPDSDDILVTAIGTIGNSYVVRKGDRFYFKDASVLWLKKTAEVSSEFINYWLKSDQFYGQLDRGNGATVDTLTIQKLQSVGIDLPSLAIQRHIVAILDEAFEGIAIAKANAEKNLRNARELFKSEAGIVFLQGFGCWPSRTVDQISRNLDSRRVPITKSDRKPGEIPYYGASGIVDYVADYIFDGDALLVSEDGANLLARSTPIAFPATGRYWVNNHAHILEFEHMATQRFVEFYLESIPLDKYITGAAQPKLNQKALNSIPIPLPPTLAEQAKVVGRLDSVAEQSELLQATYRQRLAALDELKKSLLHQAFTGQLTASTPVRVAQPATLPTTVPEFVANVIALAYARHERQGRQKTFGRVKEQKTLHLVEAVAGIDLGRQPMRDAAGPNDFQHMLRAEKWAKANNFFEMVPHDGRYEFRKLGAFEACMSKARQALVPYLPQLESAIDLLVPMDKVEAEVFTTVLAAWNNLLINGAAATDEAIVSAAREGWHADKLAIPVQKFHSAIELIRQRGLVPDGTAKYVGGQQPLL